MTNPKNLTKNMPKLQPAKQIVTSPNNNSRHRLVAPSQPPPPPVIPQQMTSPSNLPRIMPKLKPLLPNQGSVKLLCSLKLISLIVFSDSKTDNSRSFLSLILRILFKNDD